MNYMNIATAAEKWGLTTRRVQEMCKNGDIEGATRFGRAWMIPDSTQKPADRRTKDAKQHKKAVHGKFLLPVPRENPFLIHTDLYNTPGTADKLVATFSDYSETALIIESQFDYRRGNFEKIYKNVPHFLNEHGGFNSTICASVLLSFCAIYKGDLALWQSARQHLYKAPCKTENDYKILEFWLAVIDSKINDTRHLPEWFLKGNFDGLPADTYCTARVYYIKAMFINAHDLASGKATFPDVEKLGLMRALPYVLTPMLSQAKMERTVIPQIYLNLMLAVVYHNLGTDADAVPHIDKAIELCLPDELFGILSEYRNLLDGLLDERLGYIDKNTLASFKKVHKLMNPGWIKLHNALHDRTVSESLTMREREVAKLAAFGFSNPEIAKRLNIEVSSVKQYIFSAMNKVGANKRNELGLYI